MTNRKKIIIIGGGPAGLEAAAGFNNLDYEITVIEKEPGTGGKITNWHKLFPDHKSSLEVQQSLNDSLNRKKITVLTNSHAENIKKGKEKFSVNLRNGKELRADAVIIATGFELFEASRKEEYGYGIYDNVITSADLEALFNKNNGIKTTSGKIPATIAFIHCVGSRDKKSGNLYCSRICCATGVKQAIELKQLLPEARIFNFYMDLRMYGQHFEEMYIEAQQKWGINFVRGRVSEIAESIDGTLQLKAEDTLVGRPLRMNFDLIILLSGFIANPSNKSLASSAGVDLTDDLFFEELDSPCYANFSLVPGVFLAGTCKQPLSVRETIADAGSVVPKVISYLEQHSQATGLQSSTTQH